MKKRQIRKNTLMIRIFLEEIIVLLQIEKRRVRTNYKDPFLNADLGIID